MLISNCFDKRINCSGFGAVSPAKVPSFFLRSEYCFLTASVTSPFAGSIARYRHAALSTSPGICVKELNISANLRVSTDLPVSPLFGIVHMFRVFLCTISGLLPQNCYYQKHNCKTKFNHCREPDSSLQNTYSRMF